MARSLYFSKDSYQQSELAMFDLQAIQGALGELGIDGWLLYDFRGSNPLARRVLDIGEDAVTSRRFFYFVPAEGEPKRLVHAIESGVLDHLPGEKRTYLKWQEFEERVAGLVQGLGTVAMEYAPRAANPYVARVDAGTVELVRSCGVEVVSSGDLVQAFEARWDDEQWQMHLDASRVTHSAFARAFGLIAQRARSGEPALESEVVRAILDHFQEHGAVTDHDPVVAVGPHSGNPHYQTTPETDTPVGEGDFVLIDLWCKLQRPRAVFSDLTRVAYVGAEVPERYEEIFQIVARARDAAIERVEESFDAGRELRGWQVDEAARSVIEDAGYGEHFIHRTGHSIGQETHGNGANMDNLETHDERLVMPRTCFSVEPGIYLPEFGIRSEVDVFVAADGKVHVTGGEIQRNVRPLLADA